MTLDQIMERYGDFLTHETCVEAYLFKGDLYYRHEPENPVVNAGDISFNRLADGAEQPERIGLAQWYPSTHGMKLK